jgi:hypothetical protein
MAWGNFVLDKGFRTANAINKYYAVKMDSGNTTGYVTPVTGDTDVVAGFAQFGVSAAEVAKGKGASVRMDGVTVAIASAAVAVGQVVAVDTDGRVKPAAAGKRVVGICVGHPASNANDQISLMITPVGTLAGNSSNSF